ncbi:MAG: TetR/AcrR family transcriptional regulator [bacterium]|nr:TetR/AcrR family transcriptional regulator [bacterium]
MPKVTEEYTEEKKNQIMDVAADLIKEIPLYKITMRDVIKRIGYSQGMVYRYYKGVDEIFLDLINREIKEIDVQSKVDQCLQEQMSENEIIRKLFLLLGDYILAVQKKIGGKCYYEILVTYAFDETKQKELLPRLLIKQNLMYIQSHIIQYILKKEEEGVFTLDTPIEQLAVYVGDTIDGISNHAALMGNGNIDSIREEIMQLYRMVGEYVITKLTSKGKGKIEDVG